VSRLLDHLKVPVITEQELDKIRAHFITGRLRPKAYGLMNEQVARIIERMELVEENNEVLQETLDDVRRQLAAARKEI
jgi:hypothetical protein